MGEKVVLQRGNHVTIDNRGNRETRPLEDGEADTNVAKNAAPFLSGLAATARAKTIDKMQSMPNRRDAQIDAIDSKSDTSTTAYKRGGMVSKHGFSPMKTTMKRGGI